MLRNGGRGKLLINGCLDGPILLVRIGKWKRRILFGVKTVEQGVTRGIGVIGSGIGKLGRKLSGDDGK